MRPPKLLTIALSLAALLVLVAAGCGGGGSDSTAATQPPTEEAPAKLTKAELISQADAVCGEVNAAVGSVTSSAASSQSQTEQAATLYAGMASSIQELGEPAENPAEYAEFSTAAAELGKVQSEVKLAAEREDSVALSEASTEAEAALENFQTSAATYGFEDCSQGPSAPTTPSTGSGSEGEEGGIEVAPEIEEVAPEEIAPEEAAPEYEEGGGAGAIEEVAPEEGGGTESGGGGVGPG